MHHLSFSIDPKIFL